ncbi:MAG: dihydrolipoamide acetyltransferase family protein [Bacteroidota bacterium]|nr:dihydrolipoamide acetyltransferase family protein [Bacteroidota bacterium]
MATVVIMPKQGQSVETCIITRWFKHKGEAVKTGDILFSYETDKAAFDVEAPADGILLETFFGDGAEVPVLVNVAVIGNPGEETASFMPGTAEGGVRHETTEPTGADRKFETAATEPEIIAGEAGMKIRISPRARRLARQKGITFQGINGSGPMGRIIYSDIERITPGTQGSGQVVSDKDEFTDTPVSNIRKLIASAMYASLQNSAQLTHHLSADVRSLLDARKRIKEGLKNGTEKQDITLNDMVCWCVIKALKKFPGVNSHYLGDSIRIFNRVHLGIAVDTSRGLMVPAIKNASEMDLAELSHALKSVAGSCKKGNIDPALIQSTAASFTVSNLGNYGVEMFTPVINLPQTAILGVCTIVHRPADLGNNVFGFVPYMGLSLTYDHRSIDGGPVTLFLGEIKSQIENFRY